MTNQNQCSETKSATNNKISNRNDLKDVTHLVRIPVFTAYTVNVLTNESALENGMRYKTSCE